MRFLFGMGLTLLLFFLLLWNAGRQACRVLCRIFPSAKPLIFSLGLAILVFLLALLFVCHFFLPLPRALVTVMWYGAGFLVYFLMIFNVLSILLALVKCCFPKAEAARPIAGILAFALLSGVFLYGAIHAGKLKTKEYSIMLEGSEPMKIALFSDLHLGYTIGEGRLEQIRDEILQQRPDLILIVGDIFDGDYHALENPEKLKSLFREITAPFGIYACLGNHDAGKTLPEMLAFLEDAGITLLQDEAVTLKNGTVLAGRRDSSPIGDGGAQRAPLILPEGEGPVILMDHQPGNLGEYGKEIDLILCGHTHKGQMFPFGFITDALFEVDYGYYQRNEASPQVIVTSGAGLWGPPLRVASDCEIVFVSVNG